MLYLKQRPLDSLEICHPESLLSPRDQSGAYRVLEDFVDTVIREDAGFVVADAEFSRDSSSLIGHHQITLPGRPKN